MKTIKTDNFARLASRNGAFVFLRNTTGLIYLLVMLVSVMESCQAQTDTISNDGGVSVQAVVFVVIAGTMCLIFWACYFCICFSKQKCTISTTPHISPVHYSRRNIHLSNGYLQNNSAARDYDSVPRRHFLSQPEEIQSGRHSEHAATSLRVGSLHNPRRVSLPSEATLHQGDAPPTYEEAIRMKTVNFDSISQ